MAKTADASMSKFSQKLKDEDKATRGLGKKRKVKSSLLKDIFIDFYLNIYCILV